MPRSVKAVKKSNATQNLEAQRRKLNAYAIISSALENVKTHINGDREVKMKKMWEMLRFVEHELEQVVHNLDIILDGSEK